MLKDNFGRSLILVLQSEGGWVDNPHDSGGATNRGITLDTLTEWREEPCTKDDVKNLSAQEASDIYRAKYWANVRGDDLPSGVDYIVFDYAVNSSPAKAAKELQSLVGANPDCIIGAFTLKAIAAYVAIHGVETLIKSYCDRRKSFLRSLKTWLYFGKGWTNRLERVKSDALKMV
jgi:lysozyme family protein